MSYKQEAGRINRTNRKRSRISFEKWALVTLIVVAIVSWFVGVYAVYHLITKYW